LNDIPWTEKRVWVSVIISNRKYWEKGFPTNICININRYYTIYLSVRKMEKTPQGRIERRKY
jgi:hypothetical protein